MGYLQGEKPITISKLLSMRAEGEKIAMLTAYDSTMSALLNRCGVETILIGDSLGNVIQGHSSTTPVTVEQVAYHTECVARANSHAFIIADLPFASYGDPVQALDSSAELMRAGADMVKLEGGDWQIDIIQYLVERSVPVCAHLGLLPQSVHILGGYKVQGKSKDAASLMLEQAIACEQAGAQMIVLEAIPSSLGKLITESLSIPTIGIGAGADCSGQVLVLQDMLGISPGKPPKFVKNFLDGHASIEAAVKAYVREVKSGKFPGPEHGFAG
ncbi:MAG: 3-methyl-2-oxobutanoate hydroxymethyltransferase [Polynucleobacter sp. 24-46-87]|jgi:3-methyl-2-oxobutanoate hydroxymethyltransferase|uniref:3-methyl-2-oxobutanoate hydroxymethyltransferase n=1 Tax=unclassified Polynucleobacter TaxID=2640945 RepID=UPI000BDCC21C|nr:MULTISPECIES: 3-methyl-2-oxobutanoate hydroxymethyltransferase [unclassified Polynucleobacter]OYY20709.1 MAG: 3-methyl-2-oxobutanoate hydroxymethyltransferase [Polynucleobacter sp. 35-46-11]OZA15455.1 MAG: 3-methyl-2-oxobutanoate hydroxymethyltransferase [Polynucleobacter sp. 24-46-87]OZA77105.1 MAG: 3-methyl-2-oxobutanoate hydroxymethyltransferase [Polynucleobacter sp. 39-46-10]